MRSNYKWIFALLVVLLFQFSYAQEKTITGIVTDASGPLPGVNVKVRDSQRGVSTGFDGKYAIKARPGEILVFSFLGMSDISKVIGNESVINTIMSSSNKELVEVVVQGYRSVSKKTAVVSSASVSSKTLENRPNANVMNTVQGQLAGVNIAAGTGQPGGKSTVIIRGLGTLNGNSDPLYVIDGFPSNSDNFRSINSNDIESLAVLKDAAAIAEYGSRGSNGVIVIKTKSGNFGEPKTTFRYSNTYGVTQLQNSKYNFANSKQLLRIEKLATSLNSNISTYGSSLTDAQIDAYDIDTDWVNYFFRVGTSQDHTLSVENNGKTINSFTSLGYYNQEGVLQTTGLKRFTIRNNVNGKSVNDKFKYKVNTAIGHSKNNEATSLGTGAVNRNYALGAFSSAPYLSPNLYTNSYNTFYYNTNNTTRLSGILPGTGDLSATPLALIDKLLNYENLTEETRIDVATDFSYNIFKDLTARASVSGQLLNASFFQSEFPRSYNALLFNTNQASVNAGSPTDFDGFEDINKRREFFFNNLWQLSYKKNIDDHTLNISLNAEYNDSRLNVSNFRQNGLDKNLFVPNTGAGYVPYNDATLYVPTNLSALNLRNNLISYFSSVDYDYKNKYGVVASFRRDGSSRFLDSYQFGNFWSMGARWNLEEESFMKSLSFVDFFKIRGSYGTVGNQRVVNGTVFAGIIPPPFVNTFAAPAPAISYGPTYNPSFGDARLRWETTKQWNIGVDFEFFNSKLTGVFDKYNRKTIDQFFPDPQAPVFGATSFLRNSSAVLTNDGYELNLACSIIRNKEKNMNLKIRGNGSYNINKISGITANDGKIKSDLVGGNLINRNGGPAFEYNVLRYTGVNPENGNLLFQSKLGGVTENPIEDDRIETGKNYLPVYQGGFGFDFDYKGFFLATTFTFAQKVWRFDFDEESLYQQSGIGDFKKSADLINSWTPTNKSSNLPSIIAKNEGQDDISDRFLRDASYIRLRNAQIGYVVPSKFIERTFIKALSFTLQGENIFNITKWKGFDPESSRTNDSRQYPTAKIYTFGLDLKF
jgi:TonB-dependent starch-binding outer membrane protein SusC